MTLQQPTRFALLGQDCDVSDKPSTPLGEEERNFLTTEFEDKYRLARGTGPNWRSQHIGPKYLKLNGRVVYPQRFLTEWEQSCTVTTRTTVDT